MDLQYGDILCVTLFVGKIFLGKNPQGVLKLDELRDKLASKYDIGKVDAKTHSDERVDH